MPRVTIDVDLIVTTALAVVDAGGPDALSLSSVARELGVGPSALYTHVDGLSGLHEATAAASTRQLAAELRDAAIGRAGDDAVRSVAVAYRSYAVAHPGRVTTTARAEATPALDHARTEVDGIFTLLAVAQGLGHDDAARAGRNARRALQGFVVSEQSGDDEIDDDDYDAFITVLCRMLDA